MNAPLLEVRDLCVRFATAEGEVPAVSDLSLTLDAGGTLGVVGESGAGKSQAALALLGLLPRNARIGGSVRFEGRELLRMKEREWRAFRGNRIAMVFQDPMTSLNPYLRVETQIGEVLERHRGCTRREAQREAQRLLDAVQLPDAAQRLRSYPHELSGGQRQRVLIAMALACRPALLVADEPTTALDVTVQAQILKLFAELRRDFGVALLLISHDVGVISEICDQVLVMYAGRCVESGPGDRVLGAPAHPYTQGLLRSRPSLDGVQGRLHAMPGHAADLVQRVPGCAFAPRCAVALDACQAARPQSIALDARHFAACHRLT